MRYIKWNNKNFLEINLAVYRMVLDYGHGQSFISVNTLSNCNRELGRDFANVPDGFRAF